MTTGLALQERTYTLFLMRYTRCNVCGVAGANVHVRFRARPFGSRGYAYFSALLQPMTGEGLGSHA